MKKLKLGDISRHDPFKIPEGYLEDLPRQIQTRVAQMSATSPAAYPQLFSMLRLQLSFSMMVLLLVGLMVWNSSTRSHELNATALLEKTSRQEIANYLNSNTNLSLQEMAGVAYWDSQHHTVGYLPPADVLEQEILMDLDTYTIDELWY